MSFAPPANHIGHFPFKFLNTIDDSIIDEALFISTTIKPYNIDDINCVNNLIKNLDSILFYHQYKYAMDFLQDCINFIATHYFKNKNLFKYWSIDKLLNLLSKTITLIDYILLVNYTKLDLEINILSIVEIDNFIQNEIFPKYCRNIDQVNILFKHFIEIVTFAKIRPVSSDIFDINDINYISKCNVLYYLLYIGDYDKFNSIMTNSITFSRKIDLLINHMKYTENGIPLFIQYLKSYPIGSDDILNIINKESVGQIIYQYRNNIEIYDILINSLLINHYSKLRNFYIGFTNHHIINPSNELILKILNDYVSTLSNFYQNPFSINIQSLQIMTRSNHLIQPKILNNNLLNITDVAHQYILYISTENNNFHQEDLITLSHNPLILAIVLLSRFSFNKSLNIDIFKDDWMNDYLPGLSEYHDSSANQLEIGLMYALSFHVNLSNLSIEIIQDFLKNSRMSESSLKYLSILVKCLDVENVIDKEEDVNILQSQLCNCIFNESIDRQTYLKFKIILNLFHQNESFLLNIFNKNIEIDYSSKYKRKILFTVFNLLTNHQMNLLDKIEFNDEKRLKKQLRLYIYLIRFKPTHYMKRNFYYLNFIKQFSHINMDINYITNLSSQSLQNIHNLNYGVIHTSIFTNIFNIILNKDNGYKLLNYFFKQIKSLKKGYSEIFYRDLSLYILNILKNGNTDKLSTIYKIINFKPKLIKHYTSAELIEFLKCIYNNTMIDDPLLLSKLHENICRILVSFKNNNTITNEETINNFVNKIHYNIYQDRLFISILYHFSIENIYYINMYLTDIQSIDEIVLINRFQLHKNYKIDSLRKYLPSLQNDTQSVFPPEIYKNKALNGEYIYALSNMEFDEEFATFLKSKFSEHDLRWFEYIASVFLSGNLDLGLTFLLENKSINYNYDSMSKYLRDVVYFIPKSSIVLKKIIKSFIENVNDYLFTILHEYLSLYIGVYCIDDGEILSIQLIEYFNNKHHLIREIAFVYSKITNPEKIQVNKNVPLQIFNLLVKYEGNLILSNVEIFYILSLPLHKEYGNLYKMLINLLNSHISWYKVLFLKIQEDRQILNHLYLELFDSVKDIYIIEKLNIKLLSFVISILTIFNVSRDSTFYLKDFINQLINTSPEKVINILSMRNLSHDNLIDIDYIKTLQIKDYQVFDLVNDELVCISSIRDIGVDKIWNIIVKFCQSSFLLWEILGLKQTMASRQLHYYT